MSDDTPTPASEFTSITGDQLRAWLTSRGWAATDERNHVRGLGPSYVWRSPDPDHDGFEIEVYDEDHINGISTAVIDAAHIFNMTQRGVLAAVGSAPPDSLESDGSDHRPHR